MKEITVKDFQSFLKEYVQKDKKGISKETNLKAIKKKLEIHFENKAVLGFDIYRYSQFAILEQSFIPHLFKALYYFTIKDCVDYEKFFFDNKTPEEFLEDFIDSGDGGFQIFDTPMQAIIFAIYFQANIRRYNSGKDSSIAGLWEIVGEITLRYSITFDSIYKYNNNHYGPAIINNARIISKDKLNRLLIDDNTVCWFTEFLHGIENLQSITFKDLKKIKIFNSNQKVEDSKTSLLFSEAECKILNADVLKIGEIKSKLDTLSIHSVHIQARMYSTNMPGFNKYTITVGNLNSSGITEL